jgi:hypothetical protein
MPCVNNDFDLRKRSQFVRLLGYRVGLLGATEHAGAAVPAEEPRSGPLQRAHSAARSLPAGHPTRPTSNKMVGHGAAVMAAVYGGHGRSHRRRTR